MDNDKFSMLLHMIQILKKHEDKNVIESALEIIEDSNAELSLEQKAEILKEVLHMRGMDEVEQEHEACFQRESKILHADDGWF